MLANTPFVHRIQRLLIVVNGKDRSFSDGIQLGVGNDGGYFQDCILLRVKPGHLKVHPDQMVLINLCSAHNEILYNFDTHRPSHF